MRRARYFPILRDPVTKAELPREVDAEGYALLPATALTVDGNLGVTGSGEKAGIVHLSTGRYVVSQIRRDTAPDFMARLSALGGWEPGAFAEVSEMPEAWRKACVAIIKEAREATAKARSRERFRVDWKATGPGSAAGRAYVRTPNGYRQRMIPVRAETAETASSSRLRVTVRTADGKAAPYGVGRTLAEAKAAAEREAEALLSATA